MSLKPCPDCGYQVSKRAEMCPHCGLKVRAYRIKRLKKRGRILGFYGFLLLTSIIYIVVGIFTYEALLVEALPSLLITIFIVKIITGIQMKFYNYE